MKSVLSLLSLVLPALADFHVVHTTTPVINGATQYHLVGVPSNYYKCAAFFNEDRSVYGSESDIGSSTYFYLKSGLCGLGRLNFYKQSDDSWKFYVNGGDGSLQGTCYSNSATTTCGLSATTGRADDRLVCYSYICNA